MRAQSMRIGMRSDEGRIADGGNIPESALVEVRQVDQNPQPVAGRDQLLAEVRQAGSRVGRRGTTEWHAMPERIRPAPDRAERAKSRLIQDVQEFEFRVDCFRAFDMKNGANTPSFMHCWISSTLRQIRTRPCDSRSIRRRSDSMLKTVFCAGVNSTAGGNGSVAVDVCERLFHQLGPIAPSADGTKIANNPPANPPCSRLRKIQLALGLAFEERPRRVCAAAPVKAQQDVIVAVEDRHAPGRFHQKCSVAR